MLMSSLARSLSDGICKETPFLISLNTVKSMPDLSFYSLRDLAYLPTRSRKYSLEGNTINTREKRGRLWHSGWNRYILMLVRKVPVETRSGLLMAQCLPWLRLMGRFFSGSVRVDNLSGN